MKSVLLLVSLFSVQAFACPNFAGTYTCQNEDGMNETMVLTQKAIPGGMRYTSTVNGVSEDMDADGKPHVADPSEPKVTYVAKCNGAKVNSVVTGPLEEEGQVVGSMKIVSDHFMSGNKLVTKSKMTINYGSDVYEQEEESACVKK